MLLELCEDCLEYCCEYLSLNELLPLVQVNPEFYGIIHRVIDRWYNVYGDKTYQIIYGTEESDMQHIYLGKIIQMYNSVFGDNIRSVIDKLTRVNLQKKRISLFPHLFTMNMLYDCFKECPFEKQSTILETIWYGGDGINAFRIKNDEYRRPSIKQHGSIINLFPYRSGRDSYPYKEVYSLATFCCAGKKIYFTIYRSIYMDLMCGVDDIDIKLVAISDNVFDALDNIDKKVAIAQKSQILVY